MQIFLLQVTVKKCLRIIIFHKKCYFTHFDPILQQEENEDLHFRYTLHIKRTSKVWQDIFDADLFSTRYSRKMASGSLFFTKSVILPIFDPKLQREKNRSSLPLYFTYKNNLTSVASYLGRRSFWYNLQSNNGLRIIIFHKKWYFTLFWPYITIGRKKICTSAIAHISKEPHEWGKLSGVQIFLVQVTVKKWPQDHYFSQKVLFVGTPSLPPSVIVVFISL